MQAQLFSWLQTLTEEKVQELLFELLRSMGYMRVTITHGPLEHGRDLVFMEVDKLGREIWRGVQVKVTPLSGNLSTDKGLRGVLQQCEAALDTEYVTPSGKKVSLQEVWLVTTKPLSENAKLGAFGKLQKLPGVFVIDGPHLSDMLARYMPDMIQSGSKPIDEYLKNLIDFCDSIEQYMSLSLNARFLLSDVFVPSSVSVVLASGRAAKSIHPLSEQLPFADLLEWLARFTFLSRAGYLPAALHLQITEFITHLRALLQIPRKLHWYARRGEDTSELASSIGSLLGLEPFSPEGGEYLPTAYKYRCSVTVELLESIEEELRGLNFRELDVLREYALLEEVAARPTGKEFLPESIQYFDNREKKRKARNEFFESLKYAYDSSLNADAPMVKIAIQAAYILYDLGTADDPEDRPEGRHKLLEARAREVRVDPAEVARVQSNIKRLRDYLDDFHRQLTLKLETLWAELEAPVAEMRARGVLSGDKIDSLVELEHLTRFLREYSSLPDAACESLTFDSVDACLKVPKLIVIGDLGHGKTTLLKQVTKLLADEVKDEERHRLPVFCSLATLTDHPDETPARHILQSARSSFRSLENFAADEIAWLLDGFDEVRSQALKNKILDWVGSAPGGRSKMIVSSRPHAIPHYLPGGMTVTLLPFSRVEIERFIRSFPWEKASDADVLISVLDGAPELFELATTPLLLTLIVILAQTKGPERLPKRREGLFELILKLLLGDWDRSKGVLRPQAIEDENLKFMVLKKIAYRLYSKRKRSFTREEFVEATVDTQLPKPFPVDLAVRYFADLLRDCVIIPLTGESFGFFHFSIQEYLAASDLCDDIFPERIFHAMQQFLSTGGWWEEVIVFYAGIKRDVRSILSELPNKSGLESKGLDPNFLRLLRRVLAAADLTNTGELVPRGSIAAAFAELNVGGEEARWRNLISIKY